MYPAFVFMRLCAARTSEYFLFPMVIIYTIPVQITSIIIITFRNNIHCLFLFMLLRNIFYDYFAYVVVFLVSYSLRL